MMHILPLHRLASRALCLGSWLLYVAPARQSRTCAVGLNLSHCGALFFPTRFGRLKKHHLPLLVFACPILPEGLSSPAFGRTSMKHAVSLYSNPELSSCGSDAWPQKRTSKHRGASDLWDWSNTNLSEVRHP
mmetsp:Transcript_92948/g.203476  ORF Transcript_92948/g.203476 Transcript_92948/m.203476 type:complete len:132 (+) Transcript_92948:347-742(+)